MGEPLLEVDEVDFSYGPLQVLFGVSLAVGEGERVGLLGTNGAGKSTLLGTISGLHQPSRGRIRFAGEDITGLEPHERVRRGLMQIAGGRAIFPTLSLADNIRLGAYDKLHDKALVQPRLDEAMDVFPHLRARLDQPAGTLSGGEQQMVALSRALVSGARLLLIDEEPYRHGFQPMRNERLEQLAVARLGPPAHEPQHARLARAVDVGVEQPDARALAGQREREVHGHRGLADTALARRHGHEVVHAGQRLQTVLHGMRRDAARNAELDRQPCEARAAVDAQRLDEDRRAAPERETEAQRHVPRPTAPLDVEGGAGTAQRPRRLRQDKGAEQLLKVCGTGIGHGRGDSRKAAIVT